MKIKSPPLLLTTLLVLAAVFWVQQKAVAFSYQGLLDDGGLPANGSYDFVFSLHVTNTPVSPIAGPLTNTAVAVSNGLFTTIIDFPVTAFDGSERWLSVSVASNLLSPVQVLPLQPIPPGAQTRYSDNAGSLGGLAPSGYALSSHPHDGADVTSGTVNPSQGGLGQDISGAPEGSILHTPVPGLWEVLPPGGEGQVLKVTTGVPSWGADQTGSGTVTFIASGQGLTGGLITNAGTLSVDTNLIPLLTASNTFALPQSFPQGFTFGDVFVSSSNSFDGTVVTQKVVNLTPFKPLAPPGAEPIRSIQQFVWWKLQGISPDKVFTGLRAINGTNDQPGTGLFLGAADGVGTNRAGGDILIQPGLGTGTATNGLVWLGSDLVVTGSVFSSAFSGDGSGLVSIAVSNIAPGIAAIDITGNAATAGIATNAINLGGVISTNYARLDLTTNIFLGDVVIRGSVTSTNTANLKKLKAPLTFEFDDPLSRLVVTNLFASGPTIMVTASNAPPTVNGTGLILGAGSSSATNGTGGDIFILPGLGSATNGSIWMGGDLVISNRAGFGGTRLSSLTNGMRIEPGIGSLVLTSAPPVTASNSPTIWLGPLTTGTNVNGGGFTLFGGNGVGTNQSGGDIRLIPGLGSATNGSVRMGGDLVISNRVDFGGTRLSSLTNGLRIEPEIGSLVLTSSPPILLSNAPTLWIGPVTPGTNLNGSGFTLFGGNASGTNQAGGDITLLPGLGSATNGMVRVGGDLLITNRVLVGDAGNGLFRPAPGSLALATENMERLRILPDGNVGIGTTMPFERLHVEGNLFVSGTILPPSDRNRKKNFAAVDPDEVLNKVLELPIQTWSYRTEQDEVRHVGPVAQDFHSAFGLGANETTIATVDADGVALAAIQGLDQKLEVRSQSAEVRIEQLEEENARLQRQLDELRALIETLAREDGN